MLFWITLFLIFALIIAGCGESNYIGGSLVFSREKQCFQIKWGVKPVGREVTVEILYHGQSIKTVHVRDGDVTLLPECDDPRKGLDISCQSKGYWKNIKLY